MATHTHHGRKEACTIRLIELRATSATPLAPRLSVPAVNIHRALCRALFDLHTWPLSRPLPYHFSVSP